MYMKVLCFGSLNIDYVYTVDHMVRQGETLLSSSVTMNCGGKGLNQSVALARAGVSVWHAGMVGQDGKPLIDKCISNGINADYIGMTQGRSGHTIIQVDKNGDNSIVLFGGANRSITDEFIDEVLSRFDKDDIIILQNEINLLDAIIEKAWKKGMTIILNPSPYDDALDSCDLSKVSVFILNEIEGEQMTGSADPGEIVSRIHQKYPSSKIVLTLGEAGSLYLDGDSILRQSSYKVRAVDSTAAGDTFTGYFVSSLINGEAPSACLDKASAAAAITVTRPGALDSIPVINEVMEFQR